MKRQCSLRLDLLPGDPNPSWLVFDRLTGANGGIVRGIPVLHPLYPKKIIESFNRDVVEELDGSNHRKCAASLRAWGSNVCNAVFPDEIINKLLSYDSGDILFVVPLEWADLPFEILCLPDGFLGEQFQIGTIINTGLPHGPEKQHNTEGDLMIIADSSEILQSSAMEGESLKRFAVRRKRQVRLLMRAEKQKLIDGIPEASIVHFAGHSGPDEESNTAGWRLCNGKYLNVNDIGNIGAGPVLPWLVFSNSCRGGRIIVDTGLSGIAGAFLSAGVHQVVGPFCKLNDMQAGFCTISFYKHLFKGQSAAQALYLLRKKRPERAGLTPLMYRLFGDPRYKEPTQKRIRGKIVLTAAAIVLLFSLPAAGLIWLLGKTEIPGNNKRIEKTGEVAVDLNIGGIIRFSVNLYAPTFIYNEPKADSLTPAVPSSQATPAGGKR